MKEEDLSHQEASRKRCCSFRIEFHRKNHFLFQLNISSPWSLEDDFMTQNRWIFLPLCTILYLGKEQLLQFLFFFFSNQVFSKLYYFALSLLGIWIPIRGKNYFTISKTKFIHFLVPFRQDTIGKFKIC